ncbi:MAG: choice-of-anchor L domain-containing protein [Phaeodactylibacter sp.]|uniref:choice-of-anchor L domain-containing protein n=1 Tax=Phaeodactylibacter sp. TaxID=1940289 RepID=UPI0032EBC852
MSTILKKLLGAGLFVSLSLVATAQDMSVSSGGPFTPENLISNIFLGDGVEVLDINFSGNPQSVGFFNQAQDELGINRGIVMSTGFASSDSGTGVDQVGDDFSNSNMGTNLSDPDLLAITGGVDVNDMVRYTITFIPISDTLRFNYIFGSEEYPEYACSNFNDVFGFFISGPGINGPFSNNAENIALLPGTNLPVAINNLNSGQVGGNGTLSNCTPPEGSLDYSQFYNDNDNSNNQPVFDGFSNVFTAEAVVQPCSTYTIKLIIADVSDGAFDSGVFLEAKSFGTGSLDVEASTVSLDGSVAEGCAEGVLTFSLPGPVESDFPIDYQILGTAENGVDYEFIPPNLFIPAGDSSISIPIIAFEDDLDEGEETILIDVQRDPCNRDTIPILIRENPLIPADLGPDMELCRGDSLELQGELPVPLPPPPSFTSTSPVNIPNNPPNIQLFSPVTVLGVIPPTLGPGVIQSVCIDSFDHRWIDDMDFFLIGPNDQFMELVTDVGADGGNALGQDFFINTCFTPEAVTNINTLTTADLPFTGNWAPEGIWSDLYGDDKNSNGTWQLLMIDDTPSAGGTLHSWTITFNPVYEISYEWQPAAGLSCSDCPNPVATPDTTTTYILNATDSYGCTTSDTITIEVLQGPAAPALSCANVTGSSITVDWDEVTGATGGYEVSIDGGPWIPANGNTQHTINNLGFLTSVTIEVRGVGECPGESSTITCQTLDCVPPNVTLVDTTPITCNGGSDGGVEVSASGTVGPYQFALNGVENTTGIFNGLAAGDYQVAVVDGANCGTTLSITVTEPAPLEIIEQITPVSCKDAADGSIALELPAPNGPYSFDWEGLSADSLQTGLSGGDYPVAITDVTGCVALDTLTVPEPDSLLATEMVTDISCAGDSSGMVSLDLTGGTLPYQITYDGGLVAVSDSSVVIEIPAGSYAANIQDANGCTLVVPFEIQEPTPLTLQLSGMDALCADSLSGGAVVVPGGGTAAYSYIWRNEGALIGTDSVIAEVSAGTYTLELTDADGCLLTDSISIGEPDSIAYELLPFPASCSGLSDGGVEVTASGGTGTLIYSWSDIGAGPEDRSDLGSGTYFLTITDDNNCTVADSFSVTQPEILLNTTETTPTQCNGDASGTATVIPEGGTGPYTYLWEDGQQDSIATGLAAGAIEVTITDTNGCTALDTLVIAEATELALSFVPNNPLCQGTPTGSITVTPEGGAGGYTFSWSDQQSTATASNLAAGTYALTLTDANGCVLADSVTLQDPEALSSSTNSTMATCLPEPDGSATVTVGGGTPAYSYEWSDGQTLAIAQGLDAGTYTVTVTDANNCTIVDTAEVNSIPELDLEFTTESASCNGAADGAITITATGGDGNYTYTWNNGLSAQANQTGLAGGLYNLTLTDGLGCEATAAITVAQPSAIVITADVARVTCSGGEDGQIALTVTGGNPPYTTTWSNGATGLALSNLGLGTYTATVRDSNNCTATIDVEVTESSPINLFGETTEVECFGERSGGASIEVSGGLPPYTYLWSNGAETPNIEAVAAGAYTVSITDAANCTQTETLIIEQPDTALAAIVEGLDVSCFGEEDGRIEISASGGTPTYRYSIDGGASFSGNSTFIRLEPGTYDIQITDANDCRFLADAAVIGTPDPVMVDLGGTLSINYGDTIRLNPEITGGLAPFGYEWFPKDSSVLSCFRCSAPLATVEFQRSIRVIVTDIAGCTGEDIMTLYAEKFRPVLVPTGFTPNNDGVNDILSILTREGVDVDILTFRIFDRWGELIYEDNDITPNQPARGWDGNYRGKLAQPGVYLWIIEVEYRDGLREVFKGQTTLIR